MRGRGTRCGRWKRRFRRAIECYMRPVSPQARRAARLHSANARTFGPAAKQDEWNRLLLCVGDDLVLEFCGLFEEFFLAVFAAEADAFVLEKRNNRGIN